MEQFLSYVLAILLMIHIFSLDEQILEGFI